MQVFFPGFAGRAQGEQLMQVFFQGLPEGTAGAGGSHRRRCAGGGVPGVREDHPPQV